MVANMSKISRNMPTTLAQENLIAIKVASIVIPTLSRPPTVANTSRNIAMVLASIVLLVAKIVDLVEKN